METLADIALRNLRNTCRQTLSLTCAPWDSGTWMGIGHDEDGLNDQDEIDDGTDPLAP